MTPYSLSAHGENPGSNFSGRTTAKPVETTISGGGEQTGAIARRYVLTVDTIVSPSWTSRRAREGASSNTISSV